MTNKEAIDVLKRNYPSNCFEDLCRAVDIGIKALEAQIPKSPTMIVDKYNCNLWYLYCPACGTWVGMYNKRLNKIDMYNNTNAEICAKCGQALDLSEPYGGEQE